MTAALALNHLAVDPHPAWNAELRRIEINFPDLPDDDAIQETALGIMTLLQMRIIMTEPTTLEAALIQRRVLADWLITGRPTGPEIAALLWRLARPN